MSIANKREKDAAMSKRLAPTPTSHRYNGHMWPYHNNLGTSHKKLTAEGKKSLKQSDKPVKERRNA